MATERSTEVPEHKLTTLKTAFLYTLIGGLAASAILAIVAILLGEFSTGIQKAFGTLFTFVTHSLFILGIVWADRKDRLGKDVIPTAILGTAFANIITSTLGTWEVITGETAWRAFMFYMLVIGIAFLVAAVGRLRIKNAPTDMTLNIALGSIVAWGISLVPWVFAVVDTFDPLYFRIVAALSILVGTLMIIALILRTIAKSRSKDIQAEVKRTAAHAHLPGGMLAYYITVGVLTSMIWFGGMIAFIADGVNTSREDTYDLYDDYPSKYDY